MQKTIDHYIIIVEELKRLDALGNPIKDPLEADMIWPRMIAVNSSNPLYINKKIDSAISSIARCIRKNKPSLDALYSSKDWNSIFRRKIGRPLSQINLNQDVSENANSLKLSMNLVVDGLVEKGFEPVEIYFPTTWLSAGVDSFDLGPARLEARLDWLKRYSDAKQISETTKKRLEKHWQGERVRARKSNRVSFIEDSILKVFGSCEYVISVKIEGFSDEFSEDRAARIARLFLLMVSMIWQTPSKTLSGLHLAYDDLPKVSALLYKTNEQKFSASYNSITLPFGPSLSKDIWESKSQVYEPMFNQARQVAEYLANPLSNCDRIEVLRKFDLALRWFYEGCRTQDNLLATTHFASALDTLAKGGGDEKILEMLKKRVGFKKSMSFHVDGWTLSKIIKDIFKKARSQFLHGSTKNHLSDWSETRGMAEFICRSAIINCMIDADKDPDLVDFCK